MTVLPFEPLAATRRAAVEPRASRGRAIRHDPHHSAGLEPLQPFAEEIKAALGLDARAVVTFFDAAGAAVHEEAWRDLAGRALEPNVFFEPGFALAAAQHLVEAGQPRFAFVYRSQGTDPGSLIGVVPFTRSRLDVGTAMLRGWRHAFSSLGVPLLDRDHAELAVEAVFDALEQTRYHRLLLSDLQEDGPTSKLLERVSARRGAPLAVIERRRRAALLDTSGEGEAEAAGHLGAKRLKELRRQRRALGRIAPLRFQTITEPAALRAGLEVFFGLEASGWKGRRSTALVQDAGRATFVRALARDLGESRRIRLDALFLGDSMVAGALSLLAEGRLSFWKIAYDERHARFSPGVLLTQSLMQSLFEDDAVVFADSCAVEGHPMIERLWPGRLTMVDCLVSTGRGSDTGFKLALMRERTRRSWRARLKRWLRRVRPD